MKYKCRLRVILAELDIRHGVFAEKIGINKSTMSAIINGHQVPSFDVMYRIIEETGKDVREIWVKED